MKKQYSRSKIEAELGLARDKYKRGEISSDQFIDILLEYNEFDQERRKVYSSARPFLDSEPKKPINFKLMAVSVAVVALLVATFLIK